MPLGFSLRALRNLAIVVALSTGLAAQTIPDRFQKNHDIHVESGEKIGDATCLNCSIYIRGQLAGYATVLHGNVVVEQSAHVAGDVTVLLGRASIENTAQVGGDVTAGRDGSPRSRGARRRRRHFPGRRRMGAADFFPAAGGAWRDHRFDRLAGAAEPKTRARGCLAHCRGTALGLEHHEHRVVDCPGSAEPCVLDCRHNEGLRV